MNKNELGVLYTELDKSIRSYFKRNFTVKNGIPVYSKKQNLASVESNRRYLMHRRKISEMCATSRQYDLATQYLVEVLGI